MYNLILLGSMTAGLAAAGKFRAGGATDLGAAPGWSVTRATAAIQARRWLRARQARQRARRERRSKGIAVCVPRSARSTKEF